MENEKNKKPLQTLTSILGKIPLTVLLGLTILILFSLLTDRFLTVSNVMNIIVQVSSGVGIIAVASFIAICSTGVDLSIGGTVAVTGMIAARVLVLDFPMINSIREASPIFVIVIAIIAAMLSGMLLGALNGLILSKTKIPAFIITLATYRIGETMARIVGGGSSIQIIDQEAFRFLGGGSLYNVVVGGRNIGILPVSLLVLIPLYTLFHVIMKHTKFGTYIYALGGNNEASVLSGINVDKTRFLVFFLSGIIASIAGILLTSRLASGIAATGLGLEFDGIAATVVGGTAMTGGKGSPFRTLIGAFTIGALRNGLNLIGMANSVQMITIGAVLIIIVTIDAFRTEEGRQWRKNLRRFFFPTQVKNRIAQ